MGKKEQYLCDCENVSSGKMKNDCVYTSVWLHLRPDYMVYKAQNGEETLSKGNFSASETWSGTETLRNLASLLIYFMFGFLTKSRAFARNVTIFWFQLRHFFKTLSFFTPHLRLVKQQRTILDKTAQAISSNFDLSWVKLQLILSPPLDSMSLCLVSDFAGLQKQHWNNTETTLKKQARRM